MPQIAHALKGVVRSVDVEKHALTLEPVKQDVPTEFNIVEGRTRLRRDRKPAVLADLKPGQPVRLYYKRENGRWVATEIAWTTYASSPVQPQTR